MQWKLTPTSSGWVRIQDSEIYPRMIIVKEIKYATHSILDGYNSVRVCPGTNLSVYAGMILQAE